MIKWENNTPPNTPYLNRYADDNNKKNRYHILSDKGLQQFAHTL